MTADKHALILGVSGIVGRALATHLVQQSDWLAVGVSRREPVLDARVRFVQLDLLDRAACEKTLSGLVETTHVFYSAFVQYENLVAEIEPNLAMVRNAVEVLDACCPNLAHIMLTQGSKWYGNHLGPYPTPAREDQLRHPFPHFYFEQQAWLSEFQHGKRWCWSAVRPHGVWGFAEGGQINMMLAIALYASILKHMGQPLHYPGKPGAFKAIYQCTEASYLAKGMAWAATSGVLVNEPLNFTNGDYIRWCDAWPHVAAWFDMPVGKVLTFDVETFMQDKEPVWADIRKKFDLKPYRMQDLTLWRSVATNMFNADWDQMSSMAKARNLGWSGVNDTYDMIWRQFDLLANDRIIPDYHGFSDGTVREPRIISA
ncbi:SDR family oxidoreductase [Candidimonas nitroreducens]|uniref:NAD-dependent dehydratase n=1 Tax=Candidimonas nitroreducens TaxID=683354 RepID=A0A225MEK6_9BURK|nr:SDR family oxidoreductase [Candidimonas nitroreducens]OWT57389.1 NAD-dependent dehydratase [Candidimonas nitroreducens]